MQIIHMTFIRTCELDIKERIRKSQDEDEHFKSVKADLEHERNGIKYNIY
jgi:hypothetical protein